jgi:hypothetical protein
VYIELNLTVLTIYAGASFFLNLFTVNSYTTCDLLIFSLCVSVCSFLFGAFFHVSVELTHYK